MTSDETRHKYSFITNLVSLLVNMHQAWERAEKGETMGLQGRQFAALGKWG